MIDFLRNPYVVRDGVRYELRAWLAERLHALVVRLYAERYDCDCGAPDCTRDRGLSLICLRDTPAR